MIVIKHTKVLAQADGADASKVRPSDWNTNSHVVEGFAPDALDDFDPVTGATTSTLTTTTSPLTLTTADNSGAAADRLFGVKAIGDGNPQLQVNSEGWGKYGLMRSGDTVDMRLTSSPDPDTELIATLLIDGVADADCPTFSVTTASVTIYVYDTFTDSDGTLLSSHVSETPASTGWVSLAGTWYIYSNSALCLTNAGDSQNIAYRDAGYANVHITATVVSVANTDIRLACNIVDANNLWLCNVNGTTIAIYERTSGSFTLRASGSASAVSDGVDYPLVLDANGDSISFTGRGTMINYSVGSRPHKTATKHGMASYQDVKCATRVIQMESI